MNIQNKVREHWDIWVLSTAILLILFWSLFVTSLSVLGQTLANSSTLTSNSPIDPAYNIDNLWDGCTNVTPDCTTAARTASFWAEFDLKNDYALTSARLFGDDVDAWYSSTWKLDYRRTTAESWVTAFSNVNAKFNGWSTQALNVTARYVRVEVFGNVSVPATEARELELIGTLGSVVTSQTWKVEVSKTSGQSITFSWSWSGGDSNLSGWQLLRGTDLGSRTVIATGGPATRSLQATMPTGTTKKYFYVVRPIAKDGTNAGPGIEYVVNRK